MNKAMIGTMAALAMVAGMASPAAARPWGYGYHHHGGGGDGFADFLLGGLFVGGAIAIASAASRDNDRPVYASSSVADVRSAGEEARAVTSICADAAEGMSHSRVTGIDSVGREGDGWRVEGTIDTDHGNRGFACGTRYGKVDYVQLAQR